MSKYTLLLGDCLKEMDKIPTNSIDLILTDLPYNTSASEWDREIPLNLLWSQYKRIIKKNRAIVLFAQQPYTSYLITSNISMWKYNWVWEKDNATNFLNSHHQPMKITEDICVFGTGATSNSNGESMIYNPQFTYDGTPYAITSGFQADSSAVVRGSVDGGRARASQYTTRSDGKRFPKNLIKFNRDSSKLHPTQKPVKLLEYFINTYSNEGEFVLDSCMGSGSTGVACINTNRHFIGIEKEKKYFDIASDRIKSCDLLGTE